MFEIKKIGFPEREEEVLESWKNEQTFKQSLENRENAPLFSFYDGPPFATGLPHYGHLLAGTIKDVVPRYKTMKGFRVPRRFGWDCHGLPVENEIEKAKELSGAAAIEAFGIASFNEECRSIVLRYTEEWKKTVNRMGRWVDFSKTYRTMDRSFMESVWWVFKQLWDKELVYKGFKVMPFSAKLGTPLSNFEANLNYQDVNDPSITVALPLEEAPDTSLVVWTTTPWTLPSNLAVCVHPLIRYVTIYDPERDHRFIVAKRRAEVIFPKGEVLEEFEGKALEGTRYTPLFPHFVEGASEKAFSVVSDDFVDDEDGTGLVHMAPAFGEADFFVCFREGIDIVCPVDHNGKFTEALPEYEGLFVKDADKAIIKRLKEEGRLIAQSQVRHRYPFCWRSDTPLIYRAVDTWFVQVEAIKERLLEANEQIHWVPEHLKHGRFGKWLENARDWAISRNRYWGTPIPIWMSEDGDFHVIGSVEELEQLTGETVSDLHRHHIDHLHFTKNGKTYRRISEVFDCWFESGSMPYAQNHYPFEDKEATENAFPADFIAEGLDQTRGWFYTLNILSTALFNTPAFKNVIVNGIVLAEDGAKMSKRLKNYPEPHFVIDKYGADAVRLFLLHSSAVRADDVKFSERDVELVLRQILIPLWNAYVFLATYANIYEWQPKQERFDAPSADIDRWILSEVQQLVVEVEEGMDHYELARAVDPFVGFIDKLTNWYIRRSRARFWSEEDTADRREAFESLYTALKTLVKVAAPFIPFISDAIYRQLRQDGEPSSVHLCDYPLYEAAMRDQELEREMALVQSAVSMGRALRKETSMKVRQPLSCAHLITSNRKKLELLERQKGLIMDELNVRDVRFHEDESPFVSYHVKPNFKTLGKRAGKQMRALKARIEAFSQEEVNAAFRGETLTCEVEGICFTLMPEDLEVVRSVKEEVPAQSDGVITIALDIQLDESLVIEGLAREIVNKINTMRRTMQFDVVDRICVTMDASERVHKAFVDYERYVCNETLATEVTFAQCDGQSWDLNGEKAVIAIERVTQ